MQPTKMRNHSGILMSYKTENILFDCGEGTQRQMRIAGVKPAKVTRLCISHWHGDHVFGISGLLSSMGVDQFAGKLKIYGPKGSKQYIEHLLKSFAAKDIIEHEVIEIGEEQQQKERMIKKEINEVTEKGAVGKTGSIIAETEDFFLVAHKLQHSVPCIGFSFHEKDRRRIDLVKAKKMGLEGPVLGKLQLGEDVVVQGKKIKADEVTYLVPGKKVSYIADTLPCEGANKLAENADLLISEGTHLDEIKEKTEKYMHLTVKQAALIASENNAKKLVVTHLSPRYKSSADIITEARTYFDNAIVAEDFMRVKV